jgi:hypothetical protein
MIAKKRPAIAVLDRHGEVEPSTAPSTPPIATNTLMRLAFARLSWSRPLVLHRPSISGKPHHPGQHAHPLQTTRTPSARRRGRLASVLGVRRKPELFAQVRVGGWLIGFTRVLGPHENVSVVLVRTIDEVPQSFQVPSRESHHGATGSLGLSILRFGPDASKRREGLVRSIAE